jgi:beta-N-acetylhexosaminidase
MLQEILTLPIKQKIGQLFFIGIPDSKISADAEGFFRDIAPGGVCLFSRNIVDVRQTRKLLKQIRGILPIEPFLSLDQEGGLVDRLRRLVTPMPAPSSLKTPKDAKNLAELTAEIVRMLGFNMNFAPVVDVIDESRGSIYNGLYSRTFGKTKSEVVELAAAYLGNLQANGCLGCLKHFPGLGASQVDSGRII